MLGVSASAMLLSTHAAVAGNSPFGRIANPATQAAQAAAQQAQQGVNATAASQRALAAFTVAAAVRRNMDAAQQAARVAAAAAQSAVPNGLRPGGLNGDPTLWTNAGAPTQTTEASGRTEVDIAQTGAKAILNWTSFNVGQNTDLVFNQQGNASWVALNRVNDPAANPSQILGTIKAPGTVLIMNHNGIIFGGGSQVNVGALVASTLNITDAQFLHGIVNPKPYDDLHQKAFDPIFANTSGDAAGDVVVMPGSQIQTAAPSSVTTGGGFVYLFGTNVTNGGSITTPDGQAVLAAGDAVYISQSTDHNVRGVEINLGNGGKVTNAANALVSAPTGNVMLVGRDIEQDGVLLASTSIDAAGSISLLAHDGIAVQNVAFPVVNYVLPARTGSVTLAKGSLTAVLPQEDGRTALDAQPQSQSAIKVEGASTSVLGGATR
jgi:filamentous hemagglutinin family protein